LESFDRIGRGFEVNGRHVLFGRSGSKALLYATDGTPDGSESLLVSNGLVGTPDFFSGPLVYNGRLYFGSYDSTEQAHHLWSTDGTEAGTTRHGTLGGYARGQMGILDGRLLYVVADQGQGDQLRSVALDGSDPQVVWRLEIQYGEIFTFKVSGPRVYFEGKAEGLGYELFVSDGTEAGTMVLDLNPGLTSSYPSNFYTLGEGVVFTAQTATTGYELWYSDGTEAGTLLLADAMPGSLSGGAQILAVRDGLVYYCAEDYEHGMEMWVSDGTPSGTRLLHDLVPGPISSAPENGEFVDGRLMVGAFESTVGNELFSVNLESGEFRLETDLRTSGNDSSSPGAFTTDGSTAAFVARDGEAGSRVWLSDGTPEGTRPVPGSTARLGRSWDPILFGDVVYWRSAKGVWRHDLLTGATLSQELDRVDDLLASSEVLVAQSGSVVVTLDPETLAPIDSFSGNSIALTAEGVAFAMQENLVVSWTQGAGLVEVGSIPSDQRVGGAAADAVSYYIMTNDGAGNGSMWRSDGAQVELLEGRSVRCCILRSVPLQDGIIFEQEDRMLLASSSGVTILTNKGSYSSSFLRHGGLTYFLTKSTPSATLWVSDGTPDGTRELHDLPGESYPAAVLGVWNDQIVLGLESDGGHQRVYLANDERVWPVGQTIFTWSLEDAAIVGDHIVFKGNAPDTGYEVWSLNLANAVSTEDAPRPRDFELETWPNPATDLVRARLPATGTLEAFDMLGRLMGSWKIEDPTLSLDIDVAAWPVGVYALRMSSGTTSTGRLLSVVR
jgi:ELWxxDGT repeat protein